MRHSHTFIFFCGVEEWSGDLCTLPLYFFIVKDIHSVVLIVADKPRELMTCVVIYIPMY